MKVINYTKDNYEVAWELGVKDDQKELVPTIKESLALAYIVPWDEAFDPYLIEHEGHLIGAFYLSYTPESSDNYWLGGYFLDEHYQGKGYGRQSFKAILDFLKTKHPLMRVLSLTVVKGNSRATKLYESFGFLTDGKVNREGEQIYRWHL